MDNNQNIENPDQKPRKPRGFAALKANGREALIKEIASKGGKAAHLAGTAHRYTSEEARESGRKGGKAVHAKRRAKVEAEDAARVAAANRAA
jgi:general stress protein YciG